MANLPKIRYLQSLLAEYFKKNIEIIHCETKLLTAPGENYGSVMLAVDLQLKIDNEVVTKQFVAKMIPANQMLCDIFNIQESFKKELSMYLDAIPALVNFEKQSNIEENKLEDMFAKCFGGRINLNGTNTVDEDAVLLMENLKLIGYDVGDRLKGFDLSHSELIIKNLAYFHAVPIALRLLKPEVFNEKILPAVKGISLGLGDNDDDGIKFIISEVVEVLKTNNNIVPHIENIIKSLEFCLWGPYRLSNPREPFATIAHTDYWTNNTMILQNGDGKPLQNKMVDLQLPSYSSGLHDLLFFLFSSVIPSVLEPNIDYFIKLYYDNFMQRLSKFNVDLSPFNWEAFKEELLSIAPLELGHILIMFKPILTERGKIEDMSTFDESSMQRKDMVSKSYESRILNTTLTFIQRKWI